MKNKTKSPEYRVYTGMKSRCLNPNATHFDMYGGAGVTIEGFVLKQDYNKAIANEIRALHKEEE